jgi:hypothetical protein
MPPDDDDGQQAQREHARLFSNSTEEESRPEDRYEPVVVDLNEEKKEEVKSDGAVELRAQLNAQREATQFAQRQAMEAAQRAQFAEQQMRGSTVVAIDSALEAAQQQAANFKAEFQAALDAADHRAAAEAQEKLSDARHNLHRLQEQRAYVEAEARQPPPQQPPPQQQPLRVDQIAQGLAQDGYPRSADWLRSHPEWASRQDLLKRVASASNHLVDNRGLALESDEYFAALEQELGMSQRQSGNRGDYGHTQRRAGPPAAAAPTTGSVNLRTGQTAMRSHIPLTPEQRAAAIEMHGMTEKEFAQEFEKARVDGKLIGYR